MRINADCIECMIRRNLETARLHGIYAQVTEFALDLMRLILNTSEASSPAPPRRSPGCTRSTSA